MLKLSSFASHLSKASLLLLTVLSLQKVEAKEGMWVPATIKAREAEMKAMGLEIPIEKIYNTDGTGLNNAVVLFGRGCTGEIISSKGLILTNHHCGYGAVQGLSSTENDYFAKGYWAMNQQEEMPCPGLTVTFIRKMENVTDRIIGNIPDTLSDASRDSIIVTRIRNLENGYKFTTHMDASIRPFFNGNQYWTVISETYRDVRLVGFPPNGIGYFGGDVENWSWPRHTGDFSLFRVYAGKDNKPAEYSKSNVPYQAKQSFILNASGYKEGDFTMVYGFPAITQEYISSFQLNQVYAISDPIRIQARTLKLGVWNKAMADSRDVFIKYTSKRAGVANGWKKWQGEVHGLQLNNVIAKKRAYEHDFQAWAVTHDSAFPYAAGLLARMQASAEAADSLIKAEEYIREAVYGIELVTQGAMLDRLLTCFRAGLQDNKLDDSLNSLLSQYNSFYKNFDDATDKKVFISLMPLFFSNCSVLVPAYYRTEYEVHNNSYEKWANDAYKTSLVTSMQKLSDFAQKAKAEDSMRIMADPAWQLYHTVADVRKQSITPALTQYNTRISYFNRLYMKCQMAKESNTMLYPDANFTLRVSYGKVKGIDPEGAAPYSYQTTLDEAIALDNPDAPDFTVPQKLKGLHDKKDYGRWGVNGSVPIAFVADNHTSGGNSGSPVLNAKGQLIGTNFDRAWEGTMSDYYFSDEYCRNISLDIRYTLFIIEKFGNAGWLLKEMKIVGAPPLKKAPSHKK